MRRSLSGTARHRLATAMIVATVGAVLVAGVALGGASASGPTNTRLPSISGTPRPGQTLTASNGTWTGTGAVTYAYQWQRCSSAGSCADIAGATSARYAVVDADAGSTLLVVVIASDSTGSTRQASVPVPATGNAPKSTAKPTVAGAARVGSAEQAAPGTWTGTTPLSYAYQWRRCNGAGGGCADVKGATQASYTAVNDDLGHTLVVAVTANNRWGNASMTSDATPVVVLGGKSPAAVVSPSLAGKAAEGQMIAAAPGGWTTAGTISFVFQWQRCSVALDACGNIDGATKQTYTIAAADVGKRLRVAVVATNEFGASTVTSAATDVVVSAAGPGATPLPGGATSIPVANVAAPQHLVLSGVAFTPSRVKSRKPFTARFRVTDTRGHAVRGALVLVQPLPYGLVRRVAEVETGSDGWARLQLQPTAQLPMKRGSLVLFVRARKPGDNLLTGVAARRVVQVRIG